MLFLGVEIWFPYGEAKDINAGLFQEVDIRDGHKYKGVIVPLEMFAYIMRLYENKDLTGIINAFDGFLSYRLKFSKNKEICSVTDISKVEWE